MCLIYDSVLTIQDEVDLIWRRRPNVASMIFIMNRIAAITIVLYDVLEDVDNVRRLGRRTFHAIY